MHPLFHPHAMYGIFPYVWIIVKANRGKYTIHIDRMGMTNPFVFVVPPSTMPSHCHTRFCHLMSNQTNRICCNTQEVAKTRPLSFAITGDWKQLDSKSGEDTCG